MSELHEQSVQPAGLARFQGGLLLFEKVRLRFPALLALKHIALEMEPVIFDHEPVTICIARHEGIHDGVFS